MISRAQQFFRGATLTRRRFVSLIGAIGPILIGRLRASEPSKPAPSAFKNDSTIDERRSRAANTARTFYVDPVHGNDRNSGRRHDEAWQSLTAINGRELTGGDIVNLSPGNFDQSLVLRAQGTRELPVTIHLSRGLYEFHESRATKRVYHISNNDDAAELPKAVAILLCGVRHVRFVGEEAEILIHGKMIQTVVDECLDVSFAGLAFDYQRPTVSEFSVIESNADSSDIEIHPDSWFELQNGRLEWRGENWAEGNEELIAQVYDSAAGRVERCANPLSKVSRIERLAGRRLRLFHVTSQVLIAGNVYQLRNARRDACGTFANASHEILWSRCSFYFAHGMTIVAQFTEGLHFDRVFFAPRNGSGRTCSAWADVLHFSGCRGKILIEDCFFSGTNDDVVNVHGIFLQIVKVVPPNKILVRFVHSQTYGLDVYRPGDEIEFVNHSTLQDYAKNKVVDVESIGAWQRLVSLGGPASGLARPNDVVENISACPSVEIRRCRVAFASCRGFLLTTRQPVLIESNHFERTAMSAILVAVDANSWFESGAVRELTIKNNHFVGCSNPAIAILPEVKDGAEGAVHRGIVIQGNVFNGTSGPAIVARYVDGLLISENTFPAAQKILEEKHCTNVQVSGNFD